MSNLTFYDRQRIEYYLNFKQVGLRDIAKFIGRNVSIVSREIKRNKPQLVPYNAELAQKAAERKRKNTNTKKLEKCEALKDYVRSKLNEDWSPEQIAGRLIEHPPPELKKARAKTVCAETIYQHIYNQNDGEDRLYHHLRRNQPKRQKQGKRKYRAQIIPDRTSIDQRPEIINNKERYGDLETDLVLGRYAKEAVQTAYERKAMYAILQKIASKKAEEAKDALVETIENFPPNFIKSITYDNGSENTKHTNLKRDYGLETYFCDTYAAWQKGGVENLNGLIRQYIPKKTDLRTLTQERLKFIEKRLNTRPRKSLNYLTPCEVMSNVLSTV
jgi:IS30 family transposase